MAIPLLLNIPYVGVPEPRAFVVTPPNPEVNYNVDSGLPVEWQIYAENYDHTTNGLSAVCDFGPLGNVSATGNTAGIITIQNILTQRLTGSFPCDITGGNGEVLENGAILYPPYYSTPSSEISLCERNSNAPQIGAVSVNPSSINAQGQIYYGAPVTFDLPNTTDCDNEPSDLEVTLFAGSDTAAMPLVGGIYSATLNANYWGTPVYAVVYDRERGTEASSFLYSLPPIVPAPLSACEEDPSPHAYAVVGPTPDRDYDVSSGTSVLWQIYSENCDGSTNGLSAECNFGPPGTISGTSDETGVITISTPIAQRLSGNFPCDITGSNGAELRNGAILYPPYYSTPSSEISLCERNSNAPQIGAVSVNPSSINAQGQIYYGAPVTFDLPNTTDCDNEPSDLEVTLFAGSDTAAMPLVGGIYSATLNANYWGTPVYAVVYDRERGTEASSFLYSLPPIVPAPLSACEEDPSPHAYAVVGPTPDRDYDVSSGTSVLWQIYSENCDGSTNGLSAECNFGPPGTISGTSDETGVITISTPIAQRLSGNFPCDITGSNGAELRNGAILYPPYYQQTP